VELECRVKKRINEATTLLRNNAGIAPIHTGMAGIVHHGLRQAG